MPDRDRETQQERNRLTLLTARTPAGFPQRVKREAKARGMTLSAFIVTILSRELPEDPATKGEQER